MSEIRHQPLEEREMAKHLRLLDHHREELVLADAHRRVAELDRHHLLDNQIGAENRIKPV